MFKCTMYISVIQFTDKSICLFLLIVGLYSDLVKGAIFVLQSLRSGVTHLMFSCCGNYIYTGERKVL